MRNGISKALEIAGRSIFYTLANYTFISMEVSFRTHWISILFSAANVWYSLAYWKAMKALTGKKSLAWVLCGGCLAASAGIAYFAGYIRGTIVPFDRTLLHATSVRYAAPVETLIAMLPAQVTFETAALPVVTERSREPTELFSTQIFPVPVLILTAACAAAENTTLPVLAEISARSKEKSFGISILPVLSLIDSAPYSACGK